MKNNAEKYYQVRDALTSNPGYKFLERIKLHERSVHIFRGNYSDLVKVLSYLEDSNNFHKVWGEENREKQAFAHREVVRHFHNFLSAAQSLVEHTRIYMNQEHTGQQIYDSYQEKVNKNFKNNPLARFVQDLRNYFLHSGIPNSSMKLTIDTENPSPPTSEVLLNISKLKQSKVWKAESKKYIESCNDQISLKEVVESYHVKVRDFYLWFRSELDEWHKSDIEAYKKAAQEYNDFIKSNNEN